MVSSEEEPDAKIGQPVEWDTDMEIQLFYAMANYKPVGINKHFHIVGVWDKLSNSITKEVSTEDIRKHLETMYDMTMLDDTEPIPFPNDEVEFSLPEDEFGTLVKHKCKEAILGEDFEESSSNSPMPSTPRSSSRGAVAKDNTPKAGSRKDSTASVTVPAAAKARKESGSSHASTDTPSIKSEKDFERRRDSRDSNASSSRDNSSGRKSSSQKTKASPGAAWDSPAPDDDIRSRRGNRRRPNTSTPPATTPAKRRRT